MGFFDILHRRNIDRGVEGFRNTADAILLDVRTAQEYREGHIPGSVNIPLQSLDKIDDLAENKDVPIFVHCQSGGRSRQAAAILAEMGYSRVIDIGGISAYTGKVEM